MLGARHFTPRDLGLLDEISHRAEELIGGHFQLAGFGPRRYAYEVVTHEYHRSGERDPTAFAQLCRYDLPPKEATPDRRRRYYRVCLQDENILTAVGRAAGRFDLPSLLFYIMSHELIHIVRFERFEHPFVTEPAGRHDEEQVVHQLTHDLLAPAAAPPMRALLGYYTEHRIPRCL